ncbi:MAG: hypothetical protein HN904_05165 [Victivallales bacterium]|nr:hypothetical protein [Victivallales bacterium]
MATRREYLVGSAAVPAEDRSGEAGERLLRLLSSQAAHGLKWVGDVTAEAGGGDEEFAVPSGKDMAWPLHVLYNAATNAYMFAVLARFGVPGVSMGGISRERMEQMGVAMVRAVAGTHPVNGDPEAAAGRWGKWWALRMDHLFGMGAWLLWEQLPPVTQELVARILEHDADLYNQDQAPALLYDDTQGESNAWTAGGLALAHCMLKQHPRRGLWGEKAKEFMISAYATEADVTSERVVDGKPLNRWLQAPNAFPDYTVENHGFIHPIYMAAISEMVRSAICYRLAGEPVPQAATFNADHVFDALALLSLPDGNHLYVQGTDYDPRRMDSFLQACNVLALKPDPLREACFLRVLRNMERMAQQRPDMHISGDIAFAFDFGTAWGLTENYLMRRLFGGPAEAIPEEEIEGQLASVRVNELGKFAIHRTANAVSSFSWHAIERASQVMGITMPLDKDVLCCAQAGGSYIGEVVVDAAVAPSPLKVLRHSAHAREDGFGVVAKLARCSGTVTQHCAFVSLPDGRSVYMEHRVAREAISLVSAESGTVWIYDDLRWPFQKRPRGFFSKGGTLQPVSGRPCQGNWLNLDDRMGYVALGSESFTLTRSTERYHTWRLGFAHAGSGEDPQRYTPGQTISRFVLVSCPNQKVRETERMAADMAGCGYSIGPDETLTLTLSPYVVHASLGEPTAPRPDGSASPHSPQWSAGWTMP